MQLLRRKWFIGECLGGNLAKRMVEEIGARPDCQDPQIGRGVKVGRVFYNWCHFRQLRMLLLMPAKWEIVMFIFAAAFSPATSSARFAPKECMSRLAFQPCRVWCLVGPRAVPS